MSSFLKRAYISFIYFLLYLPIIVLVLFSFNQARFSQKWSGFSTQWYQQLFHDRSLWTAAWHSLLLGVSAATIAVMIGLIGAVALWRYRFVGRKFLNSLIFVLILVPDIVLGVALLMLFNRALIPLGFFSLLLAHVTFCIPFVIVTISSRASLLDRTLFEAAKDLGANERLVFSKIIIPLLKPAIIAAWLLSFSLSIDDLIISFFVSGPSFQILPLVLYSLASHNYSPEINALCSCILFVTLSVVIVAHYHLRKKSP